MINILNLEERTVGLLMLSFTTVHRKLETTKSDKNKEASAWRGKVVNNILRNVRIPTFTI